LDTKGAKMSDEVNGATEDSGGLNMTLEDFLEMHKPQFISSGVPEHLWETVYHKITEEVWVHIWLEIL
jgi:hypothetical protein